MPVNIFRRDGNSFVHVGATSRNVSNEFTFNEMEVGTWIDEKIIYRIVTTPSELTLVSDVGDPYHYTYRTDVMLTNVDQMIHGIFLGTDTDGTKFSSPCNVFVKNNYLYFSSSTTVSIETSHFNLVVEYTKTDGSDESESES